MSFTKEQENLMNTQFPTELEKEAAAEAEKVQELYSVGFSKFASETADTMDKLAEESNEEESEESEEEEKKEKLSEEHKKEASARAAFIARGYIDGLMKEGSERHGDELHYLYPAIYEKLAGSNIEKVKNLAKQTPEKLRAFFSKSKDSMMAGAKKVKDSAISGSNKFKDSKAGKHIAKNAPAYAGGAGALAGFAGGRASKKDK